MIEKVEFGFWIILNVPEQIRSPIVIPEAGPRRGKGQIGERRRKRLMAAPIRIANGVKKAEKIAR